MRIEKVNVHSINLRIFLFNKKLRNEILMVTLEIKELSKVNSFTEQYS